MNKKPCKCGRLIGGRNFPHRRTDECEEHELEALGPVREPFRPVGNYFTRDAWEAGVPNYGEF